MQLHITATRGVGAKDTPGRKRARGRWTALGAATSAVAVGLVMAVVGPQSAAAEDDDRRGPGVTDTNRGPMIENNFEVTREAAYGDNRFTVFRPADPATAGGDLPVLAFGNGACLHTDNSEVTQILTFIASKGFAVVNTGSADGSDNGVPSGEPLPSLLTDALSWAEQEQERARSPLAGQLDLTKVATAGHSCGGIEALVAGQDERVSAVVSVNSGLFADGSLGGYTRDELDDLHSPVMFLDGGPSDVAYENSQDNYDLTQVPAVLASNPDAGHGGFITGAQMADGAGAAVSFLDMVLNDDATAREYILDPSGLASQSPWSVSTKGWESTAP